MCLMSLTINVQALADSFRPFWGYRSQETHEQ